MRQEQDGHGSEHHEQPDGPQQSRHQSADMDDLQFVARFEIAQGAAEPDAEADIEKHDAQRRHGQHGLPKKRQQVLPLVGHDIEQPEALNQEQQKRCDGK